MKPPSHFAVDIDGTFLAFDETNFSKNKKAFENVLKSGYNIFFCTGRPYSSSVSILDDNFKRSSGYNGYPGVYHNGSVVYDKGGSRLLSICFDAHFMSQFCAYILAHGLTKHVVFCDMKDTYMLSDDSTLMKQILLDIDVIKDPIVATSDVLMTLNISLFIVYEKEVLTNLPVLKPGVDYELKEGSFNSWDVTPCGVNKARGLEALMSSYQCPPENCGFIGNGTNDIEAMGLCKVSFAVGNASDYVKSHAKYTLPETSDQGAFYKAMQMVYDICAE